MCTFLIYHDPDSSQPFTMASTRDEALGRKTLLPSQSHWDNPRSYWNFLYKPDSRLHLNFLGQTAAIMGDDAAVADHIARRDLRRYQKYSNAGIQGPQDPETGGLCAGVNKYGLVVAINNLEANLNVKNKLARSGLTLDALTFSSAKEAAEALYAKLQEVQKNGVSLHGERYKYPAFNLIIADKKTAYVLQSAPMEVRPQGMDISLNGGEVQRIKTETGGEITAIGDIAGQHILVSLEPIKPREPTIVCGWGQNDERSLRSARFLPNFKNEINEHPLPLGNRLSTWLGWLGLMQERTKGSGGAYINSIAQLPYAINDKTGTGEHVTWGTIATTLFAINKNADSTATARMYYSPGMPSAEERMEFQRVKSSANHHEESPPESIAMIPGTDERSCGIEKIDSPRGIEGLRPAWLRAASSKAAIPPKGGDSGVASR